MNSQNNEKLTELHCNAYIEIAFERSNVKKFKHKMDRKEYRKCHQDTFSPLIFLLQRLSIH